MSANTNRMREEQTVAVQAGDAALEGDLVVPNGATGIVLFAHGSGSSRHSPRNRFVAGALQEAGLATLLIDLLTLEEEAIDLRTRELRFDIGLLADRLMGATDWIYRNPQISHLWLGYFGASTGAAAALIAAAERPKVARAVVSRGGRPDLAGEALGARAGAYPLDRGRGRHRSDRAESAGSRSAAGRTPHEHHPRRHAPVRRAGRAGTGGGIGSRLVQRTPHGGQNLMNDNPLLRLEALGQSVWLDFLSREMLQSGELQRADGSSKRMASAASRPTRPISRRSSPAATTTTTAIRDLAAQGKDANAIYEALAIEDVRRGGRSLPPRL